MLIVAEWIKSPLDNKFHADLINWVKLPAEFSFRFIRKCALLLQRFIIKLIFEALKMINC